MALPQKHFKKGEWGAHQGQRDSDAAISWQLIPSFYLPPRHESRKLPADRDLILAQA